MAITELVCGHLRLKLLAISQAADTGPTALVAAQTGKRICVAHLVLVGDVAGTFQFHGGSTALTPAMPVAAMGGWTDSGLVLSPNILVPIFYTEKGEALNLTTVTAAARGYLLWYPWAD